MTLLKFSLVVLLLLVSMLSLLVDMFHGSAFDFNHSAGWPGVVWSRRCLPGSNWTCKKTSVCRGKFGFNSSSTSGFQLTSPTLTTVTASSFPRPRWSTAQSPPLILLS